MLNSINIEKILFLDIETVPQFQDYNDLPDKLKQLWNKKAQYFKSDNESPEDIYKRAGIYAEFGKIICVSTGIVQKLNNKDQIHIQSFYFQNEKTLLESFIQYLEKKSLHYLCAHNGKEFDFPYLCRRMLINSLKIPTQLDVAGKKPWETNFIDTMELWKFGDYKHYTSLDLLAAIFNIPSSKIDIDGSQVNAVYHLDQNLTKIRDYCLRDIVVLSRLFLKLKAIPLTKDLIVVGIE
jgi:DNA polymerase elongation subunit (family B)